MGSRLSSMVEALGILEMTSIPPPPPIQLALIIRGVRGASSQPEHLCGSATVFLQQTMTVTVLLPSAYCSNGSETHSHHRCFLWSSIEVFKDGHRAFRNYAVHGETCGSERRKPRSGLLSRFSVGATRLRAALNNQPRTLKTMKKNGKVSSLRRVFPAVLHQWKSNGVNVCWGGCHSRPARLVQLGMARAFEIITFRP
jgi:hypothetical protein